MPQTLMCVTDLVVCCVGDWYYPDGSTVQLNNWGTRNFQSNRGQNEVRSGQLFYGSVRLWHRYSPTERGHFHCELPNGINQNLYVNICEF